MTRQKNDCCSFCGRRFPDGPFPKTCVDCRNETWAPPVPVVIILAPVGDGLLGIRRGEKPKPGELALPGGYVDRGETLREAASREFREETRVIVPPEQFSIRHGRPTPDGDNLLIFVSCPMVALSAEELPKFVPNKEILERVVFTGRERLAFSLHQDAMRDYFASR